MIKRTMQAVLLATAGVLALAGPASAGSFDSGWYGFSCDPGGGGAYGAGTFRSRAWVQEFGFSGTNYLVIKARWQQQSTTAGGAWFLAWHDGTAAKNKFSVTFPNNGTSYIFDRKFVFSFHDSNDYSAYWNRIKFTVEAWDDRPGGDQLRYRATFHTGNHAC